MTPVLETERLILRGRTVADFPAYAAIWAEPAVARFTTKASIGAEDAWIKFTRMEGLWAMTGYGFWLVEEKESHAVIGEIGLADFKRAIEPALDGKPEFGWMLHPSAFGKGFAKEAVAAALRWGELKFPATIFSCIIDPANIASIRVAERHGFHRATLGRYKGADIGIYFRPPSDAAPA